MTKRRSFATCGPARHSRVYGLPPAHFPNAVSTAATSRCRSTPSKRESLRNSERSRHTRRHASCLPIHALQMLFRNTGCIDGSTSTWTHAADLQDGIFLDLDVVRNVGRFGIKAAGRQDFQFGGVER